MKITSVLPAKVGVRPEEISDCIPRHPMSLHNLLCRNPITNRMIVLSLGVFEFFTHHIYIYIQKPANMEGGVFGQVSWQNKQILQKKVQTSYQAKVLFLVCVLFVFQVCPNNPQRRWDCHTIKV